MGNDATPSAIFALPTGAGVSLRACSPAANSDASVTCVIWPCRSSIAATGVGFAAADGAEPPVAVVVLASSPPHATAANSTPVSASGTVNVLDSALRMQPPAVRRRFQGRPMSVELHP